jgi:release factor glutamine methyltransferase
LKTLVKYITSKTLQPAVKKYLGKTRTYHYKNIHLLIAPEVFHPGFFFSTRILVNYISSLQLNKKTFLELGAGSGLISFTSAKKNADVIASDINPVAIEYLKLNSEKNKLPIQIILSDLFDDIRMQQFDVIVINPPYFKKDPETNLDYAWYCGANGEYFYKLFSTLHAYMHDATISLMILSENCDIDMIKNIAEQNDFALSIVQTKKNILETNFVFSINKA